MKMLKNFKTTGILVTIMAFMSLLAGGFVYPLPDDTQNLPWYLQKDKQIESATPQGQANTLNVERKNAIEKDMNEQLSARDEVKPELKKKTSASGEKVIETVIGIPGFYEPQGEVVNVEYKDGKILAKTFLYSGEETRHVYVSTDSDTYACNTILAGVREARPNSGDVVFVLRGMYNSGGYNIVTANSRAADIEYIEQNGIKIIGQDARNTIIDATEGYIYFKGAVNVEIRNLTFKNSTADGTWTYMTSGFVNGRSRACNYANFCFVNWTGDIFFADNYFPYGKEGDKHVYSHDFDETMGQEGYSPDEYKEYGLFTQEYYIPDKKEKLSSYQYLPGMMTPAEEKRVVSVFKELLNYKHTAVPDEPMETGMAAVEKYIESALKESTIAPLDEMEEREIKITVALTDAMLNPTEEQKAIIETTEDIIKIEKETADQELTEASNDFIQVIANILLAQALPGLLTEEALTDIRALFDAFNKEKESLMEAYTESVNLYYMSVKDELIKNRAVLKLKDVIADDLTEEKIEALGRGDIDKITDKINSSGDKGIETIKEKIAEYRKKYLEPAIAIFTEDMKLLLKKYTKRLVSALEVVGIAKIANKEELE